jgi:hypothetical protein
MAPKRGGRPRRDSSPIDFDAEDDAPADLQVVADHGVYFSADGRRRDEELTNVSHKKRRVKPSDLTDSFGEWIPVPQEDYEPDGEPTAMDEVVGTTSESVLGKRKTYASSVRLELFLADSELIYICCRIIQCLSGGHCRTTFKTN